MQKRKWPEVSIELITIKYELQLCLPNHKQHKYSFTRTLGILHDKASLK